MFSKKISGRIKPGISATKLPVTADLRDCFRIRQFSSSEEWKGHFRYNTIILTIYYRIDYGEIIVYFEFDSIECNDGFSSKGTAIVNSFDARCTVYYKYTIHTVYVI